MDRFEDEFAARLRSIAEHPIDMDLAWSRLQQRMAADRPGRRYLVTAVAATVAVAIAAVLAVAAVGRNRPTHGMAHRPVSSPARPHRAGLPRPRAFRSAIVQRLPVGQVGTMALDRDTLWVVARKHGSNWIDEIGVRTGAVGWSVPAPGRFPSYGQLVAGGGTLWLVDGLSNTQVFRINPATGSVIARVDIGRCLSGIPEARPVVGYGAGRLWVACLAPTGGNERILRVSPATNRVDGRSSPIAGRLDSIVVTGPVLWYSSETSSLTQLSAATMRPTGITNSGSVPDQVSLIGVSMVLADGALWAIADGNLAEIDVANGRLVRVYPYTSWDPHYVIQASQVAVAAGSAWLYGPPVVRLNTRTGRVMAVMTAPWFVGLSAAAPGAVWLALGTGLVRLDPARVRS